MKSKLKKILTILILVILSVTGCSSNTNDKSGSSEDKKEDSIKVVTSFYPMYLLASNVVKDIDNVELINMTDSATGCLHDYSLTTDNIKLLEDCDIFIINGAGMESFLDKALEQKPDLKIIDASEGIELIKSDYMNESDSHDHEHDNDHDHNEEYNPHVWLSVENAIKQVENIENKLIEYNSINKEKYSQNAQEYIEQLTNLDNKIHSELDNLENKNIVTFHEAFPYFAKEYGLNIVGVVQREAGSEPSAKELQKIIEKIKKLDVKAICVEPQYSTKAAETISKETNVKVYTLDPIVTEESKNSSYIDIMNKNLETLKEAFK
ncbi:MULTISPECIES: metal ABC transporter substrate-binding protein [Romboutsia]|jgi:zinc transport system substrate-binding protein|uniref:Zinc ABC transporter, periplasmic-binding protein ZnuA n=1 Tax=Romboutsia ilealis TaxID=1115758 RepID=A0A1V1I2K6_9FIRM|nr:MULTISPECIES: metal ABC transporter substrate-binding protein [Romboutsia]MCI9062635.1 zinc ABC transporter substrate-binding protein [Romboutsia sp.]MCI9259794.1 zinc ABC transporter substrate-binding protein [Romboutsia sp.]CED94357.1 Zinc ABC transporter, periplasmic-binding protein ZnuA [Romboutsia ilealis]